MLISGCLQSPGAGETTLPTTVPQPSGLETDLVAMDGNATARIRVEGLAGSCNFGLNWTRLVPAPRLLSFLLYKEDEGATVPHFVYGLYYSQGEEVHIAGLVDTRRRPQPESSNTSVEVEDSEAGGSSYVLAVADAASTSVRLKVNCSPDLRPLVTGRGTEVMPILLDQFRGGVGVNVSPTIRQPGVEHGGSLDGEFSHSEVIFRLISVGNQAGRLVVTSPSGSNEYLLQTVNNIEEPGGQPGPWKLELTRAQEFGSFLGALIGITASGSQVA